MTSSYICEQTNIRVKTIPVMRGQKVCGYIAICDGDQSQASLGGVRILCGNVTSDAESQCVRLALTMQKKTGVAKLALRGAKAILFVEQASHRQAVLQAFAETLNQLAGEYITAVDVGSSQSDMDFLYQYTPFVTGHSAVGGDPSVFTAQTVISSLQAYWDSKDAALQGQRVMLQGLGKVGMHILQQLSVHIPLSLISVCDVDQRKINDCLRQYAVQVVSPDYCYQQVCDVFIGAATSFLIGHEQAQQLKCRVFIAAANNPFASSDVERSLRQNGMILLPDYLVNCGGLIACAQQYGLMVDFKEKLLSVYRESTALMSLY